MKTAALARRGAGLEGGPSCTSRLAICSRSISPGSSTTTVHWSWGKLKAGDTLELVPERDNPYDAEAIAVKFHGTMLGYIPADSVGPLSTLFFYGHGAAFECRVLQVAPERSPWHQVRAAVFVRDAR